MPRICGRLLTAALLLLATSTLAQTQPGIELQFRASNTNVRLGGSVAFHAILRNAELEMAVALRGVPGFSPGGGLQLVVIDSNGQSRTIEHSAGARSVDDITRAGNFRVLKPGESIAIRHREMASKLFPAPGRYQVQLRYVSPPRGSNALVPDTLEGAVAESGLTVFDVE